MLDLNLTLIIFFSLSVVVFMAALLAAVSPNLLYSGLGLLFSSALIAIIYIWIGQEYIAAMQLLIYAGAIMVLIIFMIMLLDTDKQPDKIRLNLRLFLAVLTTGVFLFAMYPLAVGFVGTLPPISDFSEDKRNIYGSSLLFAKELYNNYFVMIQLVAILLLLGVVGAVVLTKRDYNP